MNKNQPPAFNGYEQTTDFERARTQFSTPFDYLDVALDIAISNLILPIAGDFLYVDTAFDGIATIELNNEHSAPKAPFKVQAGWAIQAIFKQVKFSCAAQAGKKIRFMFSTGERVVPANSAAVNITGTVSTIEDGLNYGASFRSTTNLAANSTEMVFSPAANVNGAIIQSVQFWETGLNTAVSAYLAKSTTPVSLIDGDAILSVDSCSFISGSYMNTGSLKKPVKIGAGKGLYYFTNNLQAGANRSVLYTLL